MKDTYTEPGNDDHQCFVRGGESTEDKVSQWAMKEPGEGGGAHPLLHPGYKAVIKNFELSLETPR